MKGIRRKTAVFALMTAAIMVSCSRQPTPPVEDLATGNVVPGFTLTSLKGTRNGDRLDVKAVYSDGSSNISIDLRFQVTPPPRLDSGTWSGFDTKGGVQERTSTFLGGQSGPPSIGGRFDLLSPDGRPRYRVTIPLQPLHDRL